MFGSISSAGSSSSAKSRSRAWLRDSLQEQAAREARAREKRRAKLAERSAERGGGRAGSSRRWYHDLCSANSVDRPCPPNRQTLGALGRAASLETTGVGVGAAVKEEEVVLPDLPPTYSQLDLASPPPSYGPDLEMVDVSPPPNYAGLDYETLLLGRKDLSIEEMSRRCEQMRFN